MINPNSRVRWSGIPGFGKAREDPPLTDPTYARGKLRRLPYALATLILAGAALQSVPALSAGPPEEPRVIEFAPLGKEIGRPGGRLTTLIRGGRDPRALSVLGYARLVGYTPDGVLVPDIAKDVAVEEGRIFTFILRRGHRWSDGAPFTSEDFRFWWEEMATDPVLSPGGPPQAMLVNGTLPSVTVPDAWTVRFAWPAPNPAFLPELAAPAPLYIYRPAHYLKPFLPPEGEVSPDQAREISRRDRPYTADNPDLPTLEPWVGLSRPPAEQWIGRRNPHFHRVDPNGRQLPYIDEIVLIPVEGGLIAPRTASGATMLQAIGLSLNDVPILQASTETGGFDVRLWPSGRGAQLAIYPNLNAADPQIRRLMRDRAVRQALSLAVDRAEINETLYAGLADQGADTVQPGSPLYKPAYRAAFAAYDPDRASALLDGAGLALGPNGMRRLPDGEPLVLTIGTGDTDPAEPDVIALIRDHWRRIGIDLRHRPLARRAFRDRVEDGSLPLSMFYGLAAGLATASMSPSGLVPYDGSHGAWPQWGLHVGSQGRRGEAPDTDAARALLAGFARWSAAADEPTKVEAWHALLEIHAREVFSIGVVGIVPQPVTVAKILRNVPVSAPFAWTPTAYFGAFLADTFWIEP